MGLGIGLPHSLPPALGGPFASLSYLAAAAGRKPFDGQSSPILPSPALAANLTAARLPAPYNPYLAAQLRESAYRHSLLASGFAPGAASQGVPYPASFQSLLAGLSAKSADRGAERTPSPAEITADFVKEEPKLGEKED